MKMNLQVLGEVGILGIIPIGPHANLWQIWTYCLAMPSSLWPIFSKSLKTSTNTIYTQPTPPPSQFQNLRALLATPTTIPDPSWYLDLGASHHFIPDPANLLTGSEYLGFGQVFIGNGTSINIQHIGHSILQLIDSNSVFKLDNLVLIPTIAKNLISVSQFAKDNNLFFGLYLNFCYVKSQDTKEILLQGFLKDGVCQF